MQAMPPKVTLAKVVNVNEDDVHVHVAMVMVGFEMQVELELAVLVVEHLWVEWRQVRLLLECWRSWGSIVC